jgi:transposase-like protein
MTCPDCNPPCPDCGKPVYEAHEVQARRRGVLRGRCPKCARKRYRQGPRPGEKSWEDAQRDAKRERFFAIRKADPDLELSAIAERLGVGLSTTIDWAREARRQARP